MGPAIRHANFALSKEKARRKALIILSDSKPTDYDAYEGRHGVEDVHRAVLEGHTLGVRTHALCLSPMTSRHLERMFGRAGYHHFTNREATVRRLFVFLASRLQNRTVPGFFASSSSP